MAVRWAVGIAVLLAALLAPVPTAAAPTVLTFDDVPADTVLNSQYPGASFGGSARVKAYAASYVRSGTQAARSCPQYESEDLACSEPIRIDFAENQYRVKVYLGLGGQTASRTVELRIWSRGTALSSPVVLRRIRHTFPASGSPVNVLMETTFTYNAIAAVEFDILNSGNYSIVIDDFEFERGAPALAFTPDPVDFGDALVSGESVDRTVTVTNVGQVNASTRAVYVGGTDVGDFTITGESCSNRTLGPGAQCPVEVRFDPSAAGQRAASLVVERVGADPPESVRLLGSAAVTTTTSRGATTTTSPRSTTTTTTRGGTTGTTLPPATTTTIVVPPTTPGAALTIAPLLGPPGAVVTARGEGFPAGPVELSWLPGLGTTASEVGPDGVFVSPVLVLPNDRLGPRVLVAQGGGVTATVDFLVVARTVKPSAADVTQITRSRRYVNR